MKHYLLDTNICAFFLRQRYDIDKRIEEIGWENCCISDITVLELYYGAENSNNSTYNMEITKRFCENIHVVPVCEVAHRYAIEKVKLRKRGMPIDDFDLLIAATAIQKNCVLVTENIRHMDRFENLKVENWVIR